MASKKPNKEKLFPSDFWNRTEPSIIGDSDPNDTFAAVGRALTSWEMIEEELASLCVIFSGLAEDANNNKAISRLFGAIDSSGSRRNALREAGEVYFWHHDKDNVMMNKLEDLLENVSNASRRRDDIAHGVVAGFTTAKKDIGCLLIPSRYKSDRNKAFVPPVSKIYIDDTEFPFNTLPGNYRYNMSDINNISNRFYLLSQAILNFIGEVVTWKEKASSATNPPVD